MKRFLLSILVLFVALAAAAPAQAGHVRIYPSFGVHVGGYWGYPYYWGGPYPYGWYGGPGWGYPRVYPNPAYRNGALDTDVSPERAEVWVDGRKIGVADDFDGFPDYLWLEKGTYDVVFYLPGYKTIARQYSIYPGLVIDVEDKMEKGEATHPLELGPKTHERRDERLRRDQERQEELRAQQEPAWREPAEEMPLDARSVPARLVLSVEPEDASVYLDGRFLGTGGELARLRAGLVVDPGEHILQVVRPGLEEQARRFEATSGGEVELEVRLEE
ncbi:MAG: hypothetical protein KDB94_00275 [Acidobacteria bacterium]|nr:hypothetical protein [Acidobacteriota bacterium]MCB9377502.1 hypothetical protein [Holophagales bacterium]